MVEGVEASIDGALKGSTSVEERMVTLARTKKMHCCSRKGHVLNPVQTKDGGRAKILRGVSDHGECCAKCTINPACAAWEYSSTGVCITRTDHPASHVLVSPALQTWAGRPLGTSPCIVHHHPQHHLGLLNLEPIYSTEKGLAREREMLMKQQETAWKKKALQEEGRVVGGQQNNEKKQK
jgi:hypothetical protein